MKNRKTYKMAICGLAALSCVVLGSYVLRAETTAITPPNGETVAGVVPEQVLADRKALIARLEDTVRTSIADPKQAQTTKAAMLLLGQLRAEEAAPLLVEHLTFFMPDAPRFITRIPPLEDMRPQIVALDDIGLPALPSLLARRMETDDSLVNSLTDTILETILGRRVSLAYVQQAIEGQTDAVRRRRLTELRAAISRPK